MIILKIRCKLRDYEHVYKKWNRINTREININSESRDTKVKFEVELSLGWICPSENC